MMTTLKEAIDSLRIIAPIKKRKNISGELLGKYSGLVPKGKSSTAWIRGLRNQLYGKIS